MTDALDKQPQSRAPLIVAIVLLPVLYVGSYLALVIPGGIPERTANIDGVYWKFDKHYRYADAVAIVVFWPLEQIDRKLRPGAWGS